MVHFDLGNTPMKSLLYAAGLALILSPAARAGDAPATRPAGVDWEGFTPADADAWLVLQDRDFARQKAEYFAGRQARARIDPAVVGEKLGEKIEVDKLADAETWALLKRLYDQRRKAFGGGFDLTGAALDSPRGLACQVFYRTPQTGYGDGLLRANGNPTGKGWDDYWRAGLKVRARQNTHPPVTQEALLGRDGRVLRADVQAVLEMRNGERTPLVMTLFYEPREGGAGKWWAGSCCFTSSPFAAVVGRVR